MAEQSQKVGENSPVGTRKNRKCFKNFCKTSTIHGLSAIFNSRTKFLKFLWTFSFMMACGFCIWQVYELILKLVGKQTTTTTTTSIHSEIDFPILTICNSNPYRESRMIKILGSWIESIKRNYSEIAINTAIAKRLGGMLEDDLKNLSGGSDVFRMTKLQNSCLFFGQECENITTITTAILGSCIVFNGKSTVKQIRPGPDYGFSATFNILEEDYFKISFFHDAGPGILVRIGTDFSMDYHQFKNSAMFASPGMTTQIKLRKKKKQRLPQPYEDNCTKGYLVNSLHGVVFKRPPPYTVDWCKTSCLLKWQMKICGCVASYFTSMVESRVDKEKSNVIACNSTGNDELEQEHRCTTKSTNWFFSSNNHTCQCSPLCVETEYDFIISSLRWPSSTKADSLLRNIKSSWKNESLFRNWTRDSIYKNIVKIEVFFHDFQVQTIKQDPAYDFVKFLSDLGGQAGLWIGASVYSLLELVSFLASYFVKPFISDKLRKRSVRAEN